VIGDLNGDGKPDLAVDSPEPSGGGLSVLLGNGDGSFGPPQNFAAGDGPHSVALGKLNGDVFPDLAVANQREGSVSVLLGNGAGSFGRPKDLAVGAEPGSIAIYDLNGDPRPDLVVTNGAQRSVSVLLNGRSSAALSFSYGRREHRFSGGLRSIDPVCANHRWVVVLRRHKGRTRRSAGRRPPERGPIRFGGTQAGAPTTRMQGRGQPVAPRARRPSSFVSGRQPHSAVVGVRAGRGSASMRASNSP